MLTLQNIRVEANGTRLVEGVSFSISQGEVAVLMGPNGSGKSSLAQALMGHPHYTIASGTLLLDDTDITRENTENKAQRGLFLSLQHTPRIDGVTLATFLHKVHSVVRGGEETVLEYYLMLRDIAHTYGIDETLLDRPISAGLSGGQRKLSEALQLAALTPRFALLDEIDSGVDIDALKSLFSVIRKLKEQGTGFLIISHNPTLLEHLSPDTVHVMVQGSIVRSGARELAETILHEGFCVGVECPLIDGCGARRGP